MMIRRRNGLFCAAVLMLGELGTIGCGSDPTNSLAPLHTQGELVLPLVAAGQGSFRLRHAVFDLASHSGAASLRLESEASPAATSLHAELAQDSYSATLEDGWVLERFNADGASAALHAALLGPNPRDFEIRDGRVTRLVYMFTTDEGT